MVVNEVHDHGLECGNKSSFFIWTCFVVHFHFRFVILSYHDEFLNNESTLSVSIIYNNNNRGNTFGNF